MSGLPASLQRTWNANSLVLVRPWRPVTRTVTSWSWPAGWARGAATRGDPNHRDWQHYSEPSPPSPSQPGPSPPSYGLTFEGPSGLPIELYAAPCCSGCPCTRCTSRACVSHLIWVPGPRSAGDSLADLSRQPSLLAQAGPCRAAVGPNETGTRKASKH